MNNKLILKNISITNVSYEEITNKKKLILNIQYKKNKIKKFLIKEGFINLTFDFNNLYCSYCSSSECYHIYFIYREFYKICPNLIPFIFCNKFEFNENDFNNNCLNYLNSLECCYCLDKLNSKLLFWRCSKCKNLLHLECIKEWISKKNECPLCKHIVKKNIFN